MSWYRSPRTTQEARYSFTRFDEDLHAFGLVKFRGKRNKRTLPNSYDDCPCAAVDDRGWKRQTKREKQWKPIPAPRPEKKPSKFRGHPSWCYPKWEHIREYVTEYGNFWGLNLETGEYQRHWHKRTWWKSTRGEFLGYMLANMGSRWSMHFGWKKRLYTLEEIRVRGWHIR